MIARRTEVNCEICGNSFVSMNGLKKFCSDDCIKINEREKLKIRERKKGKFFVGDDMPCKDCGTIIVKENSRHLCCSDCRDKNQRDSAIRSYHANKDKRLLGLKVSRENRKIKYIENPELYESYLEKERLRAAIRRKNPKQRLDYRMSNMIRLGLKGKKQGRSWSSFVDYSLEDLYEHLENLFSDGMSWENMSEWHVDHIYPRNKLSYETENDHNFKICWSLDNLQPLWAIENLKKGNKLDYKINTKTHKGE